MQDEYFNFEQEYDTGFEVKIKKVSRKVKKSEMLQKVKHLRNNYFEEDELFEEDIDESYSRRKKKY